MIDRSSETTEQSLSCVRGDLKLFIPRVTWNPDVSWLSGASKAPECSGSSVIKRQKCLFYNLSGCPEMVRIILCIQFSFVFSKWNNCLFFIAIESIIRLYGVRKLQNCYHFVILFRTYHKS